MTYILFSRGRPIGETELAFPVVVEEARFGWFVPNAEGERLMPLLAGPSPAILAYMRRGRSDAPPDATGDATSDEETLRSTLLADYAEAAQHRMALDLELRREDGSVVATSHIALQDCEQLLLLGRCSVDEQGPEFGDLDDELRVMMEADDGDPLASDEELLASWWDDLDDQPVANWSPELDDPAPAPGERYQIYVALLQPGSIP